VSRQDVEEVLLITELARLLTLNISGRIIVGRKSTWRLYLQNKQFIEYRLARNYKSKRRSWIKWPHPVVDLKEKITFYSLTKKKLRKLYKDLNEQKSG